jgi:hypothetical protein
LCSLPCRTFALFSPGKPVANHRLTMVSARHTIPHGPQFKLLFNIPILDSGCLGLGPAAEGDQPS